MQGCSLWRSLLQQARATLQARQCVQAAVTADADLSGEGSALLAGAEGSFVAAVARLVGAHCRRRWALVQCKRGKACWR